MNNFDFCINNNCFQEILFNADDIMHNSYDEKNSYLKYRSGNFDEIKTDNYLRFEILGMLEEMGFSINKMGTYFYRDIILKIIKKLEWLDSEECYLFAMSQIDNPDNSDDKRKNLIKDFSVQYKNNLLNELNNPYSQFYFDIARNDNGIGTKTFHSYIQNSLKKLETNKRGYALLLRLAIDKKRKLNYGELAFRIADYIKDINCDKLSKNNKINIRLKRG